MKRVDRLFVKSFLPPFLLTFIVVVFILQNIFLLKYFSDFIGKDLGLSVLSQLLLYFGINTTPIAFPLAILLSSLITFGNLGEHFELTALKSSGVSLTRALLPIFVITLIIASFAYFSNDQIVPKANLKAFSLLYDIRHTKPTLDIREGVFYNGIDGYSIKVGKKYPDGITLKDMVIYDHNKTIGNKEVIVADSGKMYSILNDNYLVIELFDGNSYSESNISGKQSRSFRSGNEIAPLVRNGFEHCKMIFSLASFQIKNTDDQLFAHNRMMKSIKQLNTDIDSMNVATAQIKNILYDGIRTHYNFHLKGLFANSSPGYKSDSAKYNKRYNKYKQQQDSVKKSKKKVPTLEASLQLQDDKKENIQDKQFNYSAILQMIMGTEQQDWVISEGLAAIDTLYYKDKDKARILSGALGRARSIKQALTNQITKTEGNTRELKRFLIEKHKRLANAVACIIMFLIGAPLGSIIKKGGLGVPVLLSIIFFLVFFVLNIFGEKWARQGVVDPLFATWLANIVLLPFGLIFLRQARIDARLFDLDFYYVLLDKLKERVNKKRKTLVVSDIK